MEQKYLNDVGQLEVKMSRSLYEMFVEKFKQLTGLSLDKCFSDSGEDYFDVSIEVNNTDLPF